MKTRDVGMKDWQGGVAALMCSVAVIGLGAPRAAQAQQMQGDVVALEPLLVEGEDDGSTIVATDASSGSKMPTAVLDTAASVSVITAKEMQVRGVQNVEEVLQYTAGVVTNYYGGDDRFDHFMVRGFNAYTYRDGLLIGANFGGIREEPYAYDRIEVLKGANSTGFGISDPGGSVNYISKLPKTGRWGEVYSTVGSFAQKEVGVDFGDDLTKDGTLSYRLTGKIRDGETEVDYSRDDEKFLMGSLSWRPTDSTTVSLTLDHLDRDGVTGPGYPVGADLDRSVFMGEPDFHYRGTDRDSATFKLDHDFGGGLSAHSTIRWSKTESDFGYAYVAGTVPGTTRATRYYFANDSASKDLIADANLLYQHSFGSIESRTVAGVEYRKSESTNTRWWAPAADLDWTNPVYSGGIDLSTLPPLSSTAKTTTGKAIYLQQELNFSERVIASLGLRHDWSDVTQTNRLTGAVTTGDASDTTQRIGLTYKIRPDLSIYGSYAESVVPASSLSMEPERGNQYELGVKYAPEGLRALFTASIFDLSKTDITRTNPITMLPETLGEVRVRGLDLEAKAELTDALSLTAAYSYLDSEIVANGTAGNEGNQLSFVPENMASLWLNYTVAPTPQRGELMLGLGARYTGSYWVNDTNTQKTESAIIYDATASYQIAQNTSLAVNISNLLDEKHVAYGGFGADYYNPGRSVSATLRRTW